MGHGREKKTDQNNYHFIKETIKKKPLDKKKILCRLAAIVGSGALFGLCAAAVFANLCPVFLEFFTKKVESSEDVSITAPASLQSVTPAENSQSIQSEDTKTAQVQETITSDRTESANENSYTLLEKYEQLYNETLKASEEPRKALVKVSGLSKDEDLLDDSFVSAGTSEGILFLKTEEALYILSYADDLVDAVSIQIIFSDGTAAQGRLCGSDKETGLAVAKVNLSDVSEATQSNISVVTLEDSDSRLQAKPVIAIGSPQGNQDAVIYGMVTSVTDKLTVADAEYNLLSTDMHGSENGTGVLLNSKGEAIGFIVKQEDDNTIIRAYSMIQIKPLVEKLCNGDDLMYLGIHGITISNVQKKTLNIPSGIYVNEIENGSPAMIAGIQNGDILKSFNGKSIISMSAYSAYLQEMKDGEQAAVIVARRGADGKYADMEFKLTIEKR